MQSNQEIGVGAFVDWRMRARVRHEPHDFTDLVVGDLVITELSVIDEQSASNLVADNCGKQASPRNAENHVDGKFASSDSAKLVVSA